MFGSEDARVSKRRTVSRERNAKPDVPRLLPRQRLLLDMLHALDGDIGNLDFQKLLFLYCQELGSQSPYEFIPYQYGPFSFACYADRRKLVERGLIVDGGNRWEFTDAGKRIADGRPYPLGIANFLKRHNSRGDALVTQTYRRFPYYAIHSEIASELLCDDEATLARIDAARPRTSLGAPFTIGYERRTFDGYLNLLIQTGVTLLCDVRRNAVSRKYGFSKSTLTNACEKVGIRYEHLPRLGISSERRRSLATAAGYRRLLNEYQQRDLLQLQPEIATIMGWIASGECVALTCYERDSEHCHRSRVAAEIKRLSDTRLSFEHL